MTRNLVKIRYNGIKYQVRAGATVLNALEEVGVSFIHGTSCRQGICGSCALIYRINEESELLGLLGCQHFVVDGMEIMSTPHIPSKERNFDPHDQNPIELLLQTYPEINNCNDCNACNTICPLEIDVNNVIKGFAKWELNEAIDMSSKCVACGLCSLRCPVNIMPENIIMQARGVFNIAIAQSMVPIPNKAKKELARETMELDRICLMSKESLTLQANSLRREILEGFIGYEKMDSEKDFQESD
ncbi:2Fe-2S iron-sulfur cluster-binding protein [Prochlorococcus sp. MIT 1201]|uniref:2Fe-2S iron-sulfur cluster-binding protein n=1 Tax=Prochlorococcus sp. MIT 1201 TaxID=3082535 RepID=UPI0039A73D3B